MKTKRAERGNRATSIIILAHISMLCYQSPHLLPVPVEMLVCQDQTGPTPKSAHKSHTIRLIQPRQDSVYAPGINGEDKSVPMGRTRLLTNVPLDA